MLGRAGSPSAIVAEVLWAEFEPLQCSVKLVSCTAADAAVHATFGAPGIMTHLGRHRIAGGHESSHLGSQCEWRSAEQTERGLDCQHLACALQPSSCSACLCKAASPRDQQRSVGRHHFDLDLAAQGADFSARRTGPCCPASGMRPPAWQLQRLPLHSSSPKWSQAQHQQNLHPFWHSKARDSLQCMHDRAMLPSVWLRPLAWRLQRLLGRVQASRQSMLSALARRSSAGAVQLATADKDTEVKHGAANTPAGETFCDGVATWPMAGTIRSSTSCAQTHVRQQS